MIPAPRQEYFHSAIALPPEVLHEIERGCPYRAWGAYGGSNTLPLFEHLYDPDVQTYQRWSKSHPAERREA